MIQIKIHDEVVSILSGARHMPNLKKNLVSLNAMKSKDCKIVIELMILLVVGNEIDE